MHNILIFAGTRPEVIKLAPVHVALRERANFAPQFIVTGQHKEMLHTALADFALTPDTALDVMRPGQNLAELSARLFTGIDSVLNAAAPDFVLVQGDTMTTTIAALCAFFRHIPYGHVEAGLRSGNLNAPFPEELNRRITSIAATLHFAPTDTAREALLREGVPAGAISVTGNTAIDALLLTLRRLKGGTPPLPARVAEAVSSGRRLILVTSHRRENLDTGIPQICQSINALAARFPDVCIIFPVHMNPRVREAARGLEPRTNIVVCDPLNYVQFVFLMHKAYLLLTDSGGIQEEAPALDKPVLVLREVTERPEGVAAGCSLLVGARAEAITTAATRLLTDPAAYRKMAAAPSPYGDGRAAARIVEDLERHFSGIRQ